MISIPSSFLTMLNRILSTACVLFLAPGLNCVAQQSNPRDAIAQSTTLAAQDTPLQIVRPMAGQEAQWRGVPWTADPSQVDIAKLAASEQLRLAPEQPHRKVGGDNPIRVSGWWSIDVKNTDGSVASHREVENTYNENSLLIYLLAGSVAAGEPAILFGTGNGNTDDPYDSTNFTNSPCAGANGCLISEIPGGYWSSAQQCSQNQGSCSSNLSRSITNVSYSLSFGSGCGLSGCNPINFPSVPALELNGQITAQKSSTIGFLATFWTYCGNSQPSGTPARTGLNPTSCVALAAGTPMQAQMTYLELGSPISVSAGQIIFIKFDLSFAPYY